MIPELFESVRGADFSHDKKHRYSLYRFWDKSLPLAMCIGLNPSNANVYNDDSTICILMNVLRKLGYGGFYMMNCYTYITSKPELLKVNPMATQYNNDLLTVTKMRCKDVIFAWGAFDIIKDNGRDKELMEMFPRALCFGKNADGSPYHPRALSYKSLLKNPVLIKYN